MIIKTANELIYQRHAQAHEPRRASSASNFAHQLQAALADQAAQFAVRAIKPNRANSFRWASKTFSTTGATSTTTTTTTIIVPDDITYDVWTCTETDKRADLWR